MARKPSKLKTRHNGRFTVVFLLALALLMGYMLHQMNSQLELARTEQELYAQRLAILQETNEQLAHDIANSDDPELIEEIARNDLGMASPGEKVFRFQN